MAVTPLRCLCPILDSSVPRGAESGCHSCSTSALPVHQDQHADRQEVGLGLNESPFTWMGMDGFVNNVKISVYE